MAPAPGGSRAQAALGRPVVIDACSLLNLYAADPILDNLARLGTKLFVVPQVRAEALFVRGVGPSGGSSGARRL